MPNPTRSPFALPRRRRRPASVLVRERADGAWQVLDITVIETLTGVGEGRDAAEALARDYAATTRPPGLAPAGARPTASRGVNTHRHPHPAAARAREPGDRHDIRRRVARRRPPGSGCAAGSGSPTGACSAASCAAERHRALHLGLLHAQSDGLVELAAGTRRDGTLQIHTRARADHFLPGGGTGHDAGSKPCSRSRPCTRTAARSCSSHRRCARTRGATSTPSRTPERCGSTSTSPDSFITCGPSSPTSRATSWSRAAAGARTPTGCSTTAPRNRPATSRGRGRPDRARARADHPPPRRRSARQAERRRPAHAEIEAGSCA